VLALLQLKPVFVDVDENTFNIDPSLIEGKITSRTVAIVPVHLYGQCADMEPVLDIAARHNLQVIEDAAQALGAEYTFSDGTKRKAGAMGSIGTTSFFPSKNLGCYGDGGALLTNSSTLAERIRMIANHGQRIKYRHEIVGVNSRLDSLQAAILNVKLNYLNEYAQKRNDVAGFYDRELSKIDAISTPFRSPNSTHVFHQYTLRVPESDRENLKKHLAGNDIPTMIYYPIPLHLQEAYIQHEFGLGSFPVTERLSNTVISLPIHTEMSTDQLGHICRSIEKYF
jgi:dTDP-4-amino-4,6-dideoxygalactose transaminase